MKIVAGSEYRTEPGFLHAGYISAGQDMARNAPYLAGFMMVIFLLYGTVRLNRLALIVGHPIRRTLLWAIGLSLVFVTIKYWVSPALAWAMERYR